jgi:hypothetical protein
MSIFDEHGQRAVKAPKNTEEQVPQVPLTKSLFEQITAARRDRIADKYGGNLGF